jgi:hypothetical protein
MCMQLPSLTALIGQIRTAPHAGEILFLPSPPLKKALDENDETFSFSCVESWQLTASWVCRDPHNAKVFKCKARKLRRSRAATCQEQAQRRSKPMRSLIVGSFPGPMCQEI